LSFHLFENECEGLWGETIVENLENVTEFVIIALVARKRVKTAHPKYRPTEDNIPANLRVIVSRVLLIGQAR